jgi:hypothetical protein
LSANCRQPINGNAAASIAMTASRFSSILGFERSVDCALGRDHCRQFVVGLICVFYVRV